MAQYLLEQITIIETTGNYTSGDIVKTYYDDVTEAIVVEKNDIVVTSGDAFIEVIDEDTGRPFPFYARNATGFETTKVVGDDTFTVSFTITPSFPYALIVLTELTIIDNDADIDIIKLSLAYVSAVLPTTNTSSDGTITVIGSGDGSPYLYYDVDPRLLTYNSSLALGQATGEFTGLSAGTYTFYVSSSTATDPRLYSASATITLPYNQVPSLSNYGIRWRVEYDNFEDEEYRTDIWERGYVGSVSVVKGNGDPYALSMRGEGDDIYELNLLSSNSNISVLSETLDQFKDIAIADEKKYLVKKYKYNGATYDEKWTGYITPSSYSDVLYSVPYTVNISSNDRIGDLKAFDFVYGNNNVNTPINGNISQLSIIHLCLQKLSMGFGYRIACNIFAENHTTTDATPLEQTLINTSIYLNEDGTPNSKCDAVIKDILGIYNAVLFSWAGYWYIVRHEEWLSSSISYVEFDSDLAFVESNSWSPQIDLMTPGDTNRARLINGAQSRVFTELYSRVLIKTNLELSSEKNALLPTFRKSNVVSKNSFIGFDVLNYSSSDYWKSIPSTGDSWLFGLYANKGSNTYIQKTGTIEFSSNDELEIEFKFSSTPFLGTSFESTKNPPYGQIKWSLKIGANWLDRKGLEYADEVVNYEYFTSWGSEITVSNILKFISSSLEGSPYIFRIYIVDVEETQFVTSTAIDGFGADWWDVLNDEVRLISISGLVIGDRLAVYVPILVLGSPIYSKLSFYEIRAGSFKVDDLDIIPSTETPDSYTGLRWGFEEILDIPTPSNVFDGVTIRDSGWYTETIFSSIQMNFRENGVEKPAEEYIYKVSCDNNNNVDLPLEVNQFDVPPITNGDSLIKNYLKYTDLTPTSNWTKAGETITKSIQNHLSTWYASLAKKCRAKVSGSFRTDGVDFEPINVLRDPDDNNRLYLPIGLSSNFKRQEYTGELLEIGSDDTLKTSAFTNGFQQNAVT